MRYLMMLAAVAAATAILPSTEAAARDGCGYDYRGRLYCVDGRRPGEDYDGPRRGYRRYDSDRTDWRRHFKHRCGRNEISIGGGSARVCIRIR
jgi:hypothetical protein